MAEIKKSDCWGTPSYIIEVSDTILGGIDLDPCAEPRKYQRRVPAKIHWDIYDNGLNKPWEGKIFLNPPYSDPGAWVSTLCYWYDKGTVTRAIALLPSSVETVWFYRFVWQKASAICFLTGRLRFLDILDDFKSKHPARAGSALAYYGDEESKFYEEMRSITPETGGNPILILK